MNTATNTNQILGLNHTYKPFQVIHFEAIGIGVDNLHPRLGDVRYIPTTWQANPVGSWDSPPYTAYFSIANPGFYKLQVLFQRQIYQSGQWVLDLDEESNDELNCVEEIFIVTPMKMNTP